MKKKLRGLKRKWQSMLTNLDKLSETINVDNNEIFIRESFQYFNRKISTSYKIELFNKLVSILNNKKYDGRIYLLWYYPTDVFESVILIFNNLEELKRLIKEKDFNVVDNTNELVLNSDNFIKYVSTKINRENMISVTLNIKDEGYAEQKPLILIADDQIILIIREEL